MNAFSKIVLPVVVAPDFKTTKATTAATVAPTLIPPIRNPIKTFLQIVVVAPLNENKHEFE